MQADQLVILFLKAPIPGKAKSRLAAAIGREAALDLYRLLILDAMEMLGQTAYPVHVYYTPADAAESVASLLGAEHMLRPQAGADLGEKMERAFHDAFSAGFTRVVLIGSDLPELEPSIIAQALESLGREEAVLGPAADGGYYLIGFRKGSLLAEAFQDIAWGTSTVLEDTRKALRANGLRVHQLPTLHDLDSAADLKAFWERCPKTGARRSRVREYIEKHQEALPLHDCRH